VKITKLQKVNGYRIFRNFSWPQTGLPEFGRFNVIYGWNGSGKSSLSNIFRHIQRRTPITEGNIEIVIDQTKVDGADFATAPLPEVRTFNRDTIDRNVFEIAGHQFPPVFFLGEDSVEKQKLIEKLNKDLALENEAELRGNRRTTDAVSRYETFCADTAKAIKNLLTVAGGGPYNNFNAGNFKAASQAILNLQIPPEPLTKEQRQQYLSSKDARPMQRIDDPSVQFPDFINLNSRTHALLRRSIVSSVINELVENPTVAAWVADGLSLHSNINKCRFCDQPLPAERLQKLEAHFNNEFKSFKLELDSLIEEISQAQDFTKTLRTPPKEALYENLRQEYELALNQLNQQAQTGWLSLDALLRALNAKRNEPFKQFELKKFIVGSGPSSEPEGALEKFFQFLVAGIGVANAHIGRTAFEKLKTIISLHNKHTDSFDVEVRTARDSLARHEVLRALPEWKRLSKVISDARNQATKARENVEGIKAQISDLEIQVRQHQRPAEELTREVAIYLGRDELRFEVAQNGYHITRGGNPATHLSDGERTAIAFLYFLKSLNGTDFDLSTGIVVIDDPVSSLDANSLYSAFGFMKQKTANSGQFFVLTHNFTLFRQVREWFSHLPNQRKKDLAARPARFYMLSAAFSDGVRTAKLEPLDPFLYQYESEYHYLFKKIHDVVGNPASQGLESYYMMPNIARRLLEAFLAFRIPDMTGDLYQKLERIQFDSTMKTRILRFLHTYSHSDQVIEPDHDPSILSETPAILKIVLELIRDCDPTHFEAMNRLIQPTDEIEATTAQAA
jgi:wobble nucleotide-excising tRNase